MSNSLQSSRVNFRILFIALSVSNTIGSPVPGVFDFLFNSTSANNLTSGNSLKRHDELPALSQGGRDYGDSCDVINPCNYAKFLECIDGKCMCLNPVHHAYDDDIKECVSLAGSGCGGNGPNCVRNSQCNYGACQCLPNYRDTSTKVCLLGRGHKCQPNECNGERNLACIQGTCQCIDSLLIYQPFSGTCLDTQKVISAYIKNVGKAVAQRVVVQKISGTVIGAKSFARSIAFLPVTLLTAAG